MILSPRQPRTPSFSQDGRPVPLEDAPPKRALRVYASSEIRRRGLERKARRGERRREREGKEERFREPRVKIFLGRKKKKKSSPVGTSTARSREDVALRKLRDLDYNSRCDSPLARSNYYFTSKVICHLCTFSTPWAGKKENNNKKER